MTTSPMRAFLIATGIAVALFMSGGAKTQGIVSGCVIGGAEGISNCVQKASCPIPTVTAVSPNSGSTAGGTSVTVSGTGFTGAILVNFGPTNPAAFSVTNPTTIAVASSPAGSAGTIDVQVTTPCGTSLTSSADHYTYTAPAYQGPGDLGIGTFFAWWSCARPYSTSYAGNVCALVDSATGNTTGTLLVASSGGIITASASGSACTWVTGNACSPVATTCASACKVVTAYDQSGSTNCTTGCNITQATNSARPTYTQNAVGTASCMTFANGANTFLSINSAVTQAQPFMFYGYAERPTSAATVGGVLVNVGSANLGWDTVASSVKLFAGSNTSDVTAADNAFHTLIGVFNGTSSSLRVDATPNAGLNPSTGQINATVGIGMGLNSFAPTGPICEGGILVGNTSAGNQSTLQTNVAAFY